MTIKKTVAMMLAMGMLPLTIPAFAETVPTETQVEEAPAAAVEASAEDSQNLNASYTLALNAISSEDYTTAREYLNVCFAYCDPQSNPARYADLLLKTACIDVIEEKNDMALLSLDAAIRLQPDLADAYLVRTQVYAAQGNTDAAIESLEKYIELTEDTSLYETVAQLNEAKGDVEAAQAAYDKYVEGMGGDVQEAGFQSGLYRMQAGRLEEAISAFEAYADDATYGAGAMYNIGICKMNLGDYAGAIEAFKTCEEKGGTFDGLYYNRGVCQLMSSNWDDAGEDFTKSYASESFKNDARYNLAVCRMQQGNYDRAISLFTALINADTANDGAYYYRGVCYASNGNLEAALADYTTCIDHGYELAQSYYQRSQVYASLGDTEHQNSDLQNSLKVAE